MCQNGTSVIGHDCRERKKEKDPCLMNQLSYSNVFQLKSAGIHPFQNYRVVPKFQ